MRVVYESNNSGGSWWLSDDDWKALEATGWQVKWKDRRFLDALATKATSPEVDSVEMAISLWETVTGQDANEIGCECCGPPHYFHEEW